MNSADPSTSQAADSRGTPLAAQGAYTGICPLAAPTALRHLTGDAWLLFASRIIRLFAYGSLSVVLVFYLVGVGLTPPQIGLLLTLPLAGDTVVSLVLTTRADRLGRRRMLIAGAALMAAAGVAFAASTMFCAR